MSLFDRYIIDPVREGVENPDKGIPIPLKRLSKFTNFIEKGQYTVIGGKPTSGKRALMDYLYMYNVYKWWRELGLDNEGNPIEHPNRPPLKMFYFNMSVRPQIKWQKWMCLYLKLEYGLVVDIPTLTSQVGRLNDLDDALIEKIMAAREFFEDLENDVMTMVNGPQQPTSISNRLEDYMNSIGHTDKDGRYLLDQEHEGTLIFVYIDNTKYLLPESDGFQNMSEEGLKRKINEISEKMSKTYKINMNLIVPSKSTYSTKVKDSEPSYKELGVFADSVDLGLITYNPYNENNNKYLGYTVEDTVIRGKQRLRTVSVVRNPIGLENVTIGNWFLGECGYFAEAPHPTNEEDVEDGLNKLNTLP
jgi:hypothetical protein